MPIELIYILTFVECIAFTIIAFKYKSILSLYIISFVATLIGLPLYIGISESNPQSDLMIIALLTHLPIFIAGFGIATFFSSNVLQREIVNMHELNSQKIIEQSHHSENILLKLSLFIIIASFVHQISTFGMSIPIILTLLDIGTGSDLAIARSEYFNNSGAFGFIYHLARVIFSPIALLIILKKSMQTGFKLHYFIAIIIIFINASLTTALAPLANLFMAIFIYLIIQASSQRSYIKLFLAGSFVLISPIVLEAAVIGDFSWKTYAETIYKIFNRFSLDQLDRINTYFEIFGSSIDHPNGIGNKLYRFFSGAEPDNSLTNIAFLHHVRDYKDYYEFGNLNSNFLALTFADFGFFGMLIMTFFWGAVFGVFQSLLLSKKSSNLYYIFLVLSMMACWRLSGSQPTTVIISSGLFILIPFYFWKKKFIFRR